MRKLIQILVVVCMVVLSTQVAFANYEEETVMEGADLASINRIALGAPLYQQIGNAPSLEMLSKVFYESSRVTRDYVMSYDMVADDIRATKGIDITVLERRQAAKLFKEHVPAVADAYVILTVANNSRTSFFFDVYKSGTNDLLYTYAIRANRGEDDSLQAYNNFCEQFFKHFSHAVDKQLKKELGKKK